MPAAYEAMRDKFAQSMGYDAAQGKAARIYNAKHPGAPVTGKHHSGNKAHKKKTTAKILSYGRKK